MLILRQVIGYQQGQAQAVKSQDPQLEQELQETKKELNSILKEWKWGDKSFTTSQEFISKMKPWITERTKERKELQEFLKKHKIKSLSEINTITKLFSKV